MIRLLGLVAGAWAAGGALAAWLHRQLFRPEPHEMWVARMRAVAEQDALDGSIARHPAGKKRPR